MRREGASACGCEQRPRQRQRRQRRQRQGEAERPWLWAPSAACWLSLLGSSSARPLYAVCPDSSYSSWLSTFLRAFVEGEAAFQPHRRNQPNCPPCRLSSSDSAAAAFQGSDVGPTVTLTLAPHDFKLGARPVPSKLQRTKTFEWHSAFHCRASLPPSSVPDQMSFNSTIQELKASVSATSS